MAAEQSGRVTRKDVAHLAGVSTAVVSYVINDGPRPVAEQTRKRVLAAIEKLGYRPNALARAVKLGKTSTVGILVPDVVEPFHSWVVRDLDQRFQREGFPPCWQMFTIRQHKSGMRQMN
ncbi:LacI family DNA-binding transcriptional regulator [Arcanobacterium hippocoleae]